MTRDAWSLLEFCRTMDPQSLEVRRGDKSIGRLLWHEGRDPRLSLMDGVSEVTFWELRQIVDKIAELKGGWAR